MKPRVITIFTAALLILLTGVGTAFAFIGPGSLGAGSGGGQLQLDANGNIGFGTAAPTPTGNSNEALFGRIFTIASSSDPGISLKNLSGGGHSYTMYSRGNGRFALWDDTAGAVRLFIDPTGRVAIGATTTLGAALTSTLQVYGNISATNGISGDIYPSSIIGGAFQSTNYAFPSQLAVGTTTVGVLPAVFNVNGTSQFNNTITITDATGTPGVAGRIYFSGANLNINGYAGNAVNIDSLTVTGAIRGNLQLQYGDTTFLKAAGVDTYIRSSAQDLRLQPAAGYNLELAPNSGFVGIGTSTPTSTLQVVGTTTITTGNLKIGTSGYGVVFPDGTVQTSASSGGYWTASSTNIYNNNAGNVGVGGIVNPSAALHVGGTGFRVQGTAAKIVFSTDSDLADSSILDSWFGRSFAGQNAVGIVLNGPWGGALGYNNGSDNIALKWDNTGKVGIGTSTPVTKLDVYGASGGYDGSGYRQFALRNDSVNGLQIFGGAVTSVTGYLGFNSYYGTSYQYIPVTTAAAGIKYVGGRLDFYNDSGLTAGSLYYPTERLSIFSNGNIGISTTTPATAKVVIVPGAQPAIDAGSQKIVNIATPTGNNDAANKSYVDSVVTGAGYWTTAGSNIYNNNAGFVGVGTSAPSSTLHVVGTSTVTGNLVVSGNITGTFTGTNSGATLASSVRGNGSVFGSSYDGTTGTNYRFNDATSSPLLMVDAVNGRVGVGTASPAQTLDVNGIMRLEKGGWNPWDIYTSYNYTNSDLLFLSNGAERMRMNATGQMCLGYNGTGGCVGANGFITNGNVGIGTSTPEAPLHVRGAFGGLPANSGTASTAVMRIQASSNSVLDVGNQNTGNYSSWMQATDRTGLGITYPLLLNPNGGNVGIGTTAPSSALSVLGSGQFYSPSWDTNLNIGRLGDSIYYNGLNINSGYNGANPSLRLSQDYQGSIITSYLGSLRFGVGTSPVEAIRILSTGNVGIGTTTPATPLSVVGTTTITGNLNVSGNITGTFTGTNSGATLASSVRGNGSVFGTAFDAAGTNYRFNDASNTALLYIDATNGRVGVGTAAPQVGLDVKGIYTSGSGTGGVRSIGAGNWISMVYDESRGPTFYTNYSNTGGGSPGSFNFYTGSTELASIGTGGVYSHNVNGKISAGSSGGYINLWNGASGDLEIINTTAHNVTLYTNNQERLRVDQSGNVGIGTTTPPAALSVFSSSITQNNGISLGNSANASNWKIWMGTPGNYDGYLKIGINPANQNDYIIYSDGVGFTAKNYLSSAQYRSVITGRGDSPIMSWANTGGNFNGTLTLGQDYSSGTSSVNIVIGPSSGALNIRNNSNTSYAYLDANTGNLGIGTTAPTTARLVLVPGAQPSIDAGSQRIINVAVPLVATDAASKTYVDSSIAAATSSGTWNTSGSNIYNSNSGNVGVGTVNPSRALHVRVDDASTTGMAVARPSVIRISNNANVSGAFTGVAFHEFSGDNVMGMLGVQTTSGSGTGLGDMVFGVKANSAATDVTEYMRIQGGGNVGIGTANPATTLSVAGSSTISGNLAVGGTITGTFTGTNSGATLASSVRGNGSVFGTSFDAAGTNYRFNDASNTALLYIDATNGRVGVGTASPDSVANIIGSTAGDGGTNNGTNSILHIKQNTGWSANQPWALFVEGYSYLNGFRINGGGVRSLYGVASGAQVDFASNNGPITFTNGAAGTAERMRIDTAGNVGIGTATPWSQLTTYGNATTPSLTHGTPANATWAYGGGVDLSLFMNGISPFAASFQTRHVLLDGYAYPLALNPLGGNVGVGTSTPADKLTVAGNTTITGALKPAVLDYGSIVPVFGQRQFRINELTDVLYQADKRFTVTNGNAAYFDGSFDSSVTLPANASTVININVAGQSGVPAAGITYPQGSIYVSFYYTSNNYASMSLRTKNNGIWYSATGPTDISTYGLYRVMKFDVNGSNYLTDIELTITTDNVNSVSLSAINYLTDRWTTELELPYVTKYLNSNYVFGNFGVKTNAGVINSLLSGTGNSYLSASVGNVGIGTSTPASARLVIVPGSQPSIDAGSQRIINVAVPLSANDAVNKTYVDSAILSATSSNTWTTSGANIYNVNAGNVGIGTSTAPTYKFQVTGSFGADSGNIFSDGIGNLSAVSFLDKTNPTYFLDPSAAVALKTAGSVMLGGAGTPLAKLDIQNGDSSGGAGAISQIALSYSGGGYRHFLQSRHNTGADDGNALVLWLNASSTSGASSAPGIGNAKAFDFGYNDEMFYTAGTERMRINSTGNVGIGTSAPGANLLYVNGATLINGTLNLNGNNISSVGKLTVTTVDPLYDIGGKKYATYAASISGGVKEEYVGRGKLSGEKHQFIADIATEPEGSDLWVWYHAVDFSSDNVEVFATPSGGKASIWYEIDGTKIIFNGDASVSFSYRLVGKRHDWKDWPTFAKNQNEQASFTIK